MFESTTLLLLWIFCTYLVVQITLGISDGLKDANEELQKRLIKRLDEIVHRVRVEQDNGTYYWYDQDNNKFLAQGKSEGEIIDVLKKRFPDHIFYLESTNNLLCAKHNWEPQQARKQ